MNPEITSTERPVDAVARAGILQRVANAIAPPLQKLLESERAGAVKNVLHGTFLGHPLHPLLTDVPIGAWTVTAVCDLLEVLGFGERDGADVALGVGIAGAAAAAVTGLADWSDTKDEPQRLGVAHGLCTTSALLCYMASLAARRAGSRGLGIALSMTGYAILTGGAYLGGELSLGMQLGVKHTAVPIEPGPDFVRVLDSSAVAEGATHAADAGGIPVLVSRRGGACRTVSGVCTHRGAPLSEGTFEGACVVCPWHGSRFSVEDGSIAEGPATFPLATFETREQDGGVSVRPRTISDR